MTWSHGSLLATGLTHFLIAYNYIIMSSNVAMLKILRCIIPFSPELPLSTSLVPFFWFYFPFFPVKVTRGHTYSGQGDPCPPALSDSPVNSKLRDIMQPYVPVGVRWLSE